MKINKEVKTMIMQENFEEVYDFIESFDFITSEFHIWCENDEISINFLDNELTDEQEKIVYDEIDKEFDFSEYFEEFRKIIRDFSES